jgi:hypothetical protein
MIRKVFAIAATIAMVSAVLAVHAATRSNHDADKTAPSLASHRCAAQDGHTPQIHYLFRDADAQAKPDTVKRPTPQADETGDFAPKYDIRYRIMFDSDEERFSDSKPEDRHHHEQKPPIIYHGFYCSSICSLRAYDFRNPNAEINR